MLAAVQGHRPVRVPPRDPAESQRLPQGTILRTIIKVLEDHPEGLRAVDIQRRVEERLARPIGKSSINDRLFRNPTFERIAHGVYRLRRG